MDNDVTGQRAVIIKFSEGMNLFSLEQAEKPFGCFTLIPAVGYAAAVASHPQTFLQVWCKA